MTKKALDLPLIIVTNVSIKITPGIQAAIQAHADHMQKLHFLGLDIPAPVKAPFELPKPTF